MDTTDSPDTISVSRYTTRLAAALAAEHLGLHGPFVIHLCRRVVVALQTDQAALERLTEAVEALRAALEAPDPERAAALRSLEAERFGKGGRLS